ncbi:cytochrome P450 [Verrucomicrobia bacterium SCGC AG-212-E04]|nr:cytochrome P450 [Verrucomicrobia bacterium SCGC AG-212-E04]
MLDAPITELPPPARPIPGPRSFGSFREVMALRRDPLKFLSQLAQEYGPVSGFKVGQLPFFLFTSPDAVREILVTNHDRMHKGRALQRAKILLGEGLLTSEDEFHRRQRRLVNPAFHRERLPGYARQMVEAAQRAASTWRDGSQIDISHEMMTLTLDVVGRTLFSTDLRGQATEIGQAMHDIMSLMNRMLSPFAALLNYLPLPGTLRYWRARFHLERAVATMIRERRASGEDHGDLLSMLLLARDEEGGPGMTDQQVRDEAMTLFLAGHETTANALTWTWYLLAQHPEIEARLQTELDTVLAGATPTFEDYRRLPYTERVLTEAMRLYPPAWIVGRTAMEDLEIVGYRVPAKSILLTPQYLIHRLPEYFPEPEKFDPDRWLPEAMNARPKLSYFPFGAGPRQCAGEAFAWMEGVLVLATLARHWRAALVPDRPVEVLPAITLRPKHGLLVTIHRRG